MSDTVPYRELTHLIASLQGELLRLRVANRLIMTDDTGNLRALREKAENHDTPFYFGIALPDRVQAMADDIIRQHKRDLIKGIEDDAMWLKRLGVKASWDDERRAFLVILSGSECGFYASKRDNKPREARRSPGKPQYETKVAGIPDHLLGKVTAPPRQPAQTSSAEVWKQREQTAAKVNNAMAQREQTRKPKVKSAPTKRKRFEVIAKLGG